MMEDQGTPPDGGIPPVSPPNDRSVTLGKSPVTDSIIECDDSPPPTKINTPTRLLPVKPVGSKTPEARRYNLLYQELKIKYRNQCKTVEILSSEQADLKENLKASEDKCKLLQDQLEKSMEENTDLKQLVQQSEALKDQCEELTIITDPKESTKNDNVSVNSSCTVTDCAADNNKQKFECKGCRKYFHYQCTNLPAYQIAHFLTTPNYRKYVCVNCTIIPEGITKIVAKNRSKGRQVEGSSLNQENSSNILKSLKAFLSEQIGGIESNLNGMIESKFGENKKEISVLNENLNKVRSPIIEKDELVPATNATSWSSVVGKSANIKTLMREAKNDEKVEENEREKRSRNIIIHGAEEVGDSPEEIKKEDAQYISEILNKIGSPVKPNIITRLGEKSIDKNRPIKIVLKCKADKDSVMKNLGRLKGTERFFGKISVKDDYTTQERENIRQLTDRAKMQSNENPDRIFKVRGDSKNGWKVVSFLRK